VVVSENDISKGGIVMQNPVRDAVTLLNKTGREQSFAYRVYNAGGQLIIAGRANLDINAGTVIPLPSTVVPGIYLIELNSASMKFRKKILIGK
jgi:hypothetical protein